MQTICESTETNKQVIKIGRNPKNDIVKEFEKVSNFHAEIIIDGDQFYIHDLDSTNGTLVNGKKVRSSRINSNDKVTLGTLTELHWQEIIEYLNSNSAFQEQIEPEQNDTDKDNAIPRKPDYQESNRDVVPQEPAHQDQDDAPQEPNSNSNENDQDSNDQDEGTNIIDPNQPGDIIVETKRIELKNLNKDTISIGRDESNDIQLDYSQVSRHHSIVKKTDEGYLIHDLQSTNGTFVNGKRVDRCLLREYDQIQIGPIKLVIKKGGFEKFDQSKGVRLDVIDAMQQNQEKIFLHKTSLSVYPNEFVGLLAPAGAGKSTLVETIIGIRKPTSGHILINGTNLHENFDSFRQWIGYVPQDDIIHKELTVRQCLYFAAKLRLALNDDEINDKIDDLLDDLELTNVQHTQIGGKNERVSGGQRKRVNLGVELLAEPGLLFFDEPTTGLDPRTERKMMERFRDLADEGRTIIVITHSMESLKLLDKIICLSAGGMLTYYGPAKEECENYFNVDSAAKIYDHLQKDDAQEWYDKYKRSNQYKEYVEKRQSSIDYNFNKKSSEIKETSSQIIDFNQAKIFLERNIAIKSKDIRNTILLLAQAPIIAFLLTIGFERVNMALLMVISLSAIFFGCVNSCREIVGELTIFRRELMINLNIWSYLLGKIAILAAFCFAQALIFLPIIYLKIDMVGKSSLLMFFLFIMTSFGGIFLGLFISAISDSEEKAMTFVPIALLPQIIFAGVLFKLKNISEFISYFTFSKWSIEALLEVDIMYNVFMIVIICVILLFATYVALKRYDISRSEENNLLDKIVGYFR